jgi:hypothetical protein
MKIFSNVWAPAYKQSLIAAVEAAGWEYTEIMDDTVDFVLFGKNNSYDFYVNSIPEKFKTNINLDLLHKEKMQSALRLAGVNYIPTNVIEGKDTILNFSENEIFIKPTEGGASQTPYSFAYKTYTDKQSLIDAIEMEIPGFSDGSNYLNNYVIQKAFLPSEDGYVKQYQVPVIVNHVGEISFEGLGDMKMRFEPRNDELENYYPLRNMRDLTLRNTEDDSDTYKIKEQIQQFVNFYNIKSTPMFMQWVIDTQGKSYCIDLAYHFLRQVYCTEGLSTPEFWADKLKWMLGLQPNILMPLTGWYAFYDVEILGNIEEALEYADTLGIKCPTSFIYAFGQDSKVRPFVYNGVSKEDCISKFNTFKQFLANQTPS